MAEMITITVEDGEFEGWLASPAKPRGAGVLVIQEIFGLNDNIKAICQAWADEGYHSLAPDLFWRMQPKVLLDPNIEEQKEKGFDYYQRFDIARGMDDLKSSLAHLRGIVGGKVGCVGFCLGGFLAYQMATQSNVDASAGYYGVGIENHLDQATAIRAPLILHIAGEDSFCPPEAQAKLHEHFDDHPLVTLYDYAGQEHAFARIKGEDWDEESARHAFERNRDLFAKVL